MIEGEGAMVNKFADALETGIAKSVGRKTAIEQEITAVLEEVRQSTESFTQGGVTVAYSISYPEPFPVQLISQKADVSKGDTIAETICFLAFWICEKDDWVQIKRPEPGSQEKVCALEDFRTKMGEVLSHPQTGRALYRLSPAIVIDKKREKTQQIAAFKGLIEDAKQSAEISIFAAIINVAADILNTTDADFAEWFGCTVSIVNDWKTAVRAPHPTMRRAIYRVLLKRIEQSQTT